MKSRGCLQWHGDMDLDAFITGLSDDEGKVR